ncbi:MAG: type IA DNA topoisomerase [Lachnospiraceae bacterium]|nr:type IA DNA topoisomerase [Lachnospiraceae bacterium]
MGKSLYIAEKPSVAQEFAKALKINAKRKDGYLESEEAVVTWCVGHLITMSYPEVYDPALKRWSLETLPFLPKEWKYEVIPAVEKQFNIVKELLNRSDVETIYVCTDSGREGEYIYRLVEQMAGVEGKNRKRVWIDSQTEEEILRGIETAKDLSEYDNLSASAYLRAKEDYLMGINFSRVLTLKYGDNVSNYLRTNRKGAIAVGRVMTCVLGMIVNREREIRAFVKTPFYRVLANVAVESGGFDAEWRVTEESKYNQSPYLYKENGFKESEKAKELIEYLSDEEPIKATVKKVERKKEKKAAPLLYNLAELQNDCSKRFKLSPDETLRIVQELYEKKMVTYPRTDARVLSTAVAKVIYNNIRGLKSHPTSGMFAQEILDKGMYKGLEKTKYVNDKQITDHYAIIPTGQGVNGLASLPGLARGVYELIMQRFLSIFYPAAEYSKLSVELTRKTETFFASFKVLLDEGYMKVLGGAYEKKKDESGKDDKEDAEDVKCDASMLEALAKLKKGDVLEIKNFQIKEGETSPPKRYNSGSIILAMENAGQLIEDEELRAQIKGSGIGTSATRAEILKKLVNIEYINLNKKTQILTPTLLGEMVYEVVNASIRHLLNPELTASWEKGLTLVANGEITADEYMEKLEGFVSRRTMAVTGLNNQSLLRNNFDVAASYYTK